jgi:hypothetical protein
LGIGGRFSFCVESRWFGGQETWALHPLYSASTISIRLLSGLRNYPKTMARHALLGFEARFDADFLIATS